MNRVIQPIESHAAKEVFLYVERSKDTGKLFSALAIASGQFEEPKKSRRGQYGNYADLASLRRATKTALAANNLALIQTYHLQGDEMVLNTTLCHASGEYISSQIPIKQSTNPQQTTSYATYMRRMAYASILSVAAEDEDDGEGASDAATSAEVEGWESLYRRALKSIQTAQTVAEIDAVMAKVTAMAADRRMQPDSPVRMQSAANQRKVELRKGGDGEAAGGVAK
jgi:hypothetical protein